MRAEIIPISGRFLPLRVEVTEPGTFLDGRRALFVDYVECDGGRCIMWSGSDYDEAMDAARDCSDEGRIRIVDLTRSSPTGVLS